MFGVIKGALIESPGSDGIRHGVTRVSGIQLAENEMGTPTVERSIVPREPCLADELFLTGACSGVVPIVEVDRRTVGKGEVGP